jgi:hypothetical protein
MWRYLDAAFPAAASSRMTVRCRASVWESFRRTIVVKDVRLQLNLETIHSRYGVSVVHLRRHPCAVISSLLSAKWPWNFDRLRLIELIAPFIHSLDTEMRATVAAGRFDADAASRIAAYWAITERLTERTLRERPWAIIVAYEDAVRDPAATTNDIYKLIGRRPFRPANPNFDSVSTIASSRGVPSQQRSHTWRSRLASADIDRIHRVVEAIYPEALAELRSDVA